MPALDGLRALAITGVLVSHFLPRTNICRDVAHWGRLGVVLFFVLSGFLITSILLRAREETGPVDFRETFGVLRRFYTRRFLRIFPIYYFSIAALALFDGNMRKDIWWHFTYTSNFLMAYVNSVAVYAEHLWSLSVEEQFYLIWPWLVLFLPRRLMPRLFWGLVIVAISYKFVGCVLGTGWVALSRLIYGNTDSLAIGGLLAFYRETGSSSRLEYTFLVKTGIRFALPCFIALQFFRYAAGEAAFRSESLYVGFNDFFASIVFVALISSVTSNSKTFLTVLLSFKPVRYIGKVSYGIYLYHLFLRHGIQVITDWFHLPLPPEGLSRFALYTALSVLVAVVSWELVERPLNSMKKAHPYVRTKTV